MPLRVHRNRAYFVGTDSRGIRFDVWIAIHAMPIRYRKNI
jgi:hypothetical protein